MVLLRKLTMEDADTTFAYSSDFENTYYMLNSPFLTIEETKHLLTEMNVGYHYQVTAALIVRTLNLLYSY